jgi:anti-anti-sigma factor
MLYRTEISHEIRAGIAILRLHGAIELPTVEELKVKIAALIDRREVGAAVFVLGETPLIDSSGLGLFISLHRKYQGRKLIRYCEMTANVRAVLSYAHLLDKFEIDESLDDSLAALGAPTEARPQPALPDKDRSIDLPAKYLLTETGQRYCTQHRIPVRDLRSYSGDRATGFEWSRCRIDLMRKLVVHDLLTTIEIARPEFVTRRKELIELLRTILCGIIIKRFRPELKHRLRRREEVAAIAADPRQAAILADKALLQAALRGNSAWAETLLATVKAICDHDLAAACVDGQDPEDLRAVEELIAAIDEETQYILAIGGPDLVGLVAEVVLSFRRRMEITEHLSLMLMEFIQVAEKSFLLNLAERELYVRSHPEELERMLGEREFREKLLLKAEERGELVVFRLSFFGTFLDPLAPSHVEISLRNRGLIGYSSRQDVLSRRQKMVKENSLDEILKADAASGEGSGLGLIYHTRIEEACAREGMGFSGSVRRDEPRDETVATITLSL